MKTNFALALAAALLATTTLKGETPVKNPSVVMKTTRAPIKNEAANRLKNAVGTVAMARTNEPNSATAQFFINVKENGFLDYRDSSPQGIGYCVFGKVTAGMDVVEKIKAVPTGAQDVPKTQVVIESIRVAP